MLDFIYNITLNPLSVLLESLFIFLYELSNSYGLSIILLSVVLNIVLSPLITIASKKEKKIIQVQEKINPKIKSIKEAFKGEEQISMIKTLYRQNHYNPFYSLLSNSTLLIQIPFFITLFLLLKDYSVLKGQNFLFIQNLALPDSLFFSFNLLPMIMLIISIFATWIQSKSNNYITYKTYIIPLIFFVLVYNMPSILLIYWITNNIFYLYPKKMNQKLGNIKLFFYQSFILFLFLIITNYTWLPFILFVKYNNFYIFFIYLIILSLMITLISGLLFSIIKENKVLENIQNNNKLFYLTTFTLLFYLYFVFTSFFISSEDIIMFGDFFIEQLYLKAFVYLFVSFIVFFIFYISFDEYKKKIALLLLSSIVFVFLVNAFFLNYNYGLLDTFIFPFSEKLNISIIQSFIHILLVLFILYFSFIVLKKYQIYLTQILIILNIVGLITIFINFSQIQTLIEKQKLEFEKNTSKNIFHYSKTGKNIVIIMLDRAFAGFVPDIFTDNSALKTSFEGFTWYPNTLSSSNNTLGGLQTIYGGENYKIDSISSYKRNMPLKDKRDNAYKLYIDNFSKKNYELLYFAPTLAGSNFSGDCSIFNNKSLECFNTFRTKIDEHNIKSDTVISKVYKQLMMLSIFKGSPLILKKSIYQKGFWLGNSAFQVIATNLYKTHKDNLEMLIKLSDTNAKKDNTFKIITNLLTHSPSFTDQKCNSITTVDKELVRRFKDIKTAKHYQSMSCSMKILNNYFDWFKKNGIYENTMFVLVSDHAYPLYNPMYQKAFGKTDYNFSYYHSLLMVKPFNQKDSIKTDFTYRMNYETPYMVCEQIGGCYDSFFNDYIKKSKVKKEIQVFDTPWLFDGQNIDSYNINKKYLLEFPFNKNNTEEL